MSKCLFLHVAVYEFVTFLCDKSICWKADMPVFMWQTFFAKYMNSFVYTTRNIDVQNPNSTQVVYCFCNDSNNTFSVVTRATSVLLEGLKDGQSLWNTTSESYKTRIILILLNLHMVNWHILNKNPVNQCSVIS